jgi:hypothetical protein
MSFNTIAMLMPSVLLIIPLFIKMDHIYDDHFIYSYFVLTIITLTFYIVYREVSKVLKVFDDSQAIIYCLVLTVIMPVVYHLTYAFILQFENILPELTSYIITNLFYTMFVLKIAEMSSSKESESEKEDC